MMTSSYGNIFRVTDPLWGESARHQWFHLHKGQWREEFIFSLICTWTNGWANNRGAGDLRRYRAHYDVAVIYNCCTSSTSTELYVWHIFGAPYAFRKRVRWEQLIFMTSTKWKRFLNIRNSDYMCIYKPIIISSCDMKWYLLQFY